MTAGAASTSMSDATMMARASQDIPKRRLSRQVAADTVAIGDGVSIVIGGLLPALVYVVIGNIKVDQYLIVQSTVLAGFIAHLCLRFRGAYDTSRMDRFPQVPLELLIAICCGLTGVLGIGLPLALHNIDLFVWYAFWISASYTLILLNRIVARKVLAKLAADGRFDQRIAVFGAGQIARRVHDYLKSPGLGIHFVGVYDDRAGQDRLNPEGLEVAGKLDELVEECRAGKVDRIIVALPQSANTRLEGIVEKFERLPVSTHVVTHIASDLLEKNISYNVSNLGPVGLLDVKKKLS